MQLLTAFTENEEIYSFLIYVTNQQQQKENRGRSSGSEDTPSSPPGLAL